MTQDKNNDAIEPDPQGDDHGLSSERRSIWSEFAGYLMENKKWWLIPIIVVILLFILILALGSTPAGVFIYTIF